MGYPPIQPPTPTNTLQMKSTINLLSMKNDETGNLILQGVVRGTLMMIYAFSSKNTTMGTLVWGLIIDVVSG